MKSIILCEGKTDAILLSYYLGKVVEWNFNKNLTKRVALPIKNWQNEEVNVYTKGENELIIWAVGGQSNFEYAIKQIIKANRIAEKENAYAKIIIMRDRDVIEDNEIVLKEVQDIFHANNINLEITANNQWSSSEYVNEYNEKAQIKEINEIKVLPIIIPFNKNGALETFILDAISEMGQEESHIVNMSKEFISNFDLLNYLNTQRLKVKGELAVTLGTMFLQKTFTPIDAMLKDINWEDYRTIKEGFRKLEEI